MFLTTTVLVFKIKRTIFLTVSLLGFLAIPKETAKNMKVNAFYKFAGLKVHFSTWTPYVFLHKYTLKKFDF